MPLDVLGEDGAGYRGKASQRSGARKSRLVATRLPEAQAAAGRDPAAGQVILHPGAEPAQHVAQTASNRHVRLGILSRER
jgi:hypothetical protein